MEALNASRSIAINPIFRLLGVRLGGTTRPVDLGYLRQVNLRVTSGSGDPDVSGHSASYLVISYPNFLVFKAAGRALAVTPDVKDGAISFNRDVRGDVSFHSGTTRNYFIFTKRTVRILGGVTVRPPDIHILNPKLFS